MFPLFKPLACGALFTFASACYPEVHVVDLRASEPSWQPVYAAPAELAEIDVEDGRRRGWPEPSDLNERDATVVAVRADLLAGLDSLRGVHLAIPDGDAFAPIRTYVRAPGTQAVRVVNDTTLALERLGTTTLIGVADPTAPTLLEPPEEVVIEFPDPTVPPVRDARDRSGLWTQRTRYFLCPDAHAPAEGERFLGWRIGYSSNLTDICFHP